MKGRVSLVGAGPGDPGLLTLKAAKRLKEADLIIYDTLANPAHLKHAKATAETFCVGKDFRHRKISQEKVNRRIAEAARRGQNVVRLKGGDPYLFGRGGEEALYLADRKIPFEVVPGVTSATACAAYAGIPLTHREHNASVTFLTGHRAHDEDLDSIDWKKAAALGGTLVIYMGFYNLAKIAAHLTRAGMPGRTPVAVVEWGTLPRQRCCAGTLESIAAVVNKAGLHAPCMIFIGDVVSLRERLNWFERLPLFGKRVLITRTTDRAGYLAKKLSDLGAEPIELPLIEVRPPASYAPMDRAIRDLGNFDWATFTSVYGVRSFFDRLAHLKKDSRSLSGLRVAAVGPETASELRRRGVLADLIPERFETRALVEAFSKRRSEMKNKKVLLLRADIAPPELEHSLRRLGAKPTRVTAYRTRLPQRAAGDLRKVLDRGVDAVTFTSSSTARHFVKALGKTRLRKLPKRIFLASIGPVTSAEMRSLGLKPAAQADPYTIEGLLSVLRRMK